MQFTDILSKFEDVSEMDDGGYIARCPAHDDSRPSLRIWRGDDLKVRVHCRAGCAFSEVAVAADIPQREFFDAAGEGATVPKERPTIVGTGHVAGLRMWLDGLVLDSATAEYAKSRFGLDADYLAELGISSYAPGAGAPFVHASRAFSRYPRMVVPLLGWDGVARGAQGRDISGECPGRWLSLTNPQGHRWAPYGVFRGSGGYGVILVTEGPGDGLTGLSVGYDVVMVRGAALAGSPDLIAELADGMRGYQVIACGDNDESGQRFNRVLSEGLRQYDIPVYRLGIPDLGPKTDLTDWRKHDPAGFPLSLHLSVKAARLISPAKEVEAEAEAIQLSAATGADTVSREEGGEAVRILAGLIEQYGDTDAMNAHALVAWTGGRIRWAEGLGFYVWNGVVWERSTHKVRQEIHRMGAALMIAGKTAHARPFAMTSRIDDMMTELRSVPSVYVNAAEFDNRPHLLSFRNGTVDLRTGELRPHDKADMLTYCLDLDYKADAECPRWESFLTEIFPGMPDLPPFIQRLAGYGVTGSVDEQCFAVLWGKGANGKSVLTDTLTTVFRAVSKTTPFATFESKGNSGGIPNDIAALRGARLVMASEGEAGKPMSEAVLKRVTGKDEISARFLRQEFFEFKPSFLIMLATNHKPTFKGQDTGLWRRVKMIPFTRYFAPHERERGLDVKLLAEAEGIAAWAVRGAVDYYARGGLDEPKIVSEATEEYKETSNALAGFFPGVLVVDASARLEGSKAFNAYLDWCEAENLPPRERWTRRAFYQAMAERDIHRVRTAKGMALVGVRLADEIPPPTGPGIFSQD